MSYQQFDLIVDFFRDREGINLIRWTPAMIKVEYYPHLHSVAIIEDDLESIGISIRKKEKENLVGKFLKKMAKENKETFGSKKLDCCDLNGGLTK